MLEQRTEGSLDKTPASRRDLAVQPCGGLGQVAPGELEPFRRLQRRRSGPTARVRDQAREVRQGHAHPARNVRHARRLRQSPERLRRPEHRRGPEAYRQGSGGRQPRRLLRRTRVRIGRVRAAPGGLRRDIRPRCRHGLFSRICASRHSRSLLRRVPRLVLGRVRRVPFHRRVRTGRQRRPRPASASTRIPMGQRGQPAAAQDAERRLHASDGGTDRHPLRPRVAAHPLSAHRSQGWRWPARHVFEAHRRGQAGWRGVDGRVRRSGEARQGA